MVRSRWLSACCSIVLAGAALGACSSESDSNADDDMKTAGKGGSLPPLMAFNAGSAGSAGTSATPMIAGTNGASASSAGTGGSSAGGGGSAAGTGGSSAGSGGAMAAAGAGAAGASSSPDSGVPEEEDPFAGLLGPAEVSCEGLLCLEAGDCASLYPEENATCKFTDCVDFTCK